MMLQESSRHKPTINQGGVLPSEYNNTDSWTIVFLFFELALTYIGPYVHVHMFSLKEIGDQQVEYLVCFAQNPGHS